MDTKQDLYKIYHSKCAYENVIITKFCVIFNGSYQILTVPINFQIEFSNNTYFRRISNDSRRFYDH